MIALLRDLYVIARPAGRRSLVAALGLVALQALIQTLAVFSLIPFLQAAADPVGFRASPFGARFAAAVGGGSDERVLLWAGSLALALLIFGNIVVLLAESSRNRYAYRVAHALRMRLLGDLLVRRYEYFTQTSSSVLLKHLVEDVSAIAGQLVMPALELIARLLLIVLLIGAALLVEPWVVLGGAVAIATFYVAVMQPVRSRAEATSKRIMEDIRAFYFEIYQILGGIKPILATGRRAAFMARAERASRAMSDDLPRVPIYAAIPRSVLEIVVFGGMIVWVLAALAGGGDLVALIPRIGLVAIVAYRLMPSIQAVFALMALMLATRQALDEVTALFAEQGAMAAVPPGAAEIGEALAWSNEIRFENVSFRYVGAETEAIEDVSFTLPKGGRIAFVGPTGSGKSTLVDLLLGLLEPTSGQILVDDEPLTAERMPAWRRAVGYVPQELFLLDATMAENLAFGADVPPDAARVREVAELAQARDFIEDGRTGGFEARVGERGVRLSGGQRQRLALARALYGHPNLLILDEATSALDPRTERKVVAALNEARQALTVVTVTHRLATVKDYDCIHYVEHGRIVVSGDHAAVARLHDDDSQARH